VFLVVPYFSQRELQGVQLLLVWYAGVHAWTGGPAAIPFVPGTPCIIRVSVQADSMAVTQQQVAGEGGGSEAAVMMHCHTLHHEEAVVQGRDSAPHPQPPSAGPPVWCAITYPPHPSTHTSSPQPLAPRLCPSLPYTRTPPLAALFWLSPTTCLAATTPCFCLPNPTSDPPGGTSLSVAACCSPARTAPS
jgi:hypothetical protein